MQRTPLACDHIVGVTWSFGMRGAVQLQLPLFILHFVIPCGSTADRKRTADVVSEADVSSRKRRERVVLTSMLKRVSFSSNTASASLGESPTVYRHRRFVRKVSLSCQTPNVLT